MAFQRLPQQLLSRLDRACMEALHATDGEKLPVDLLQQLGESLVNARLTPHNATRIVPSTQALVSNWRTRKPGVASIEGPGEGALVTRAGGKVAVQALDPAATEFVQQLMNSATVLDSYDKAAEIDAKFDLSQCFAELLTAGAFSSVSTDPAN